MSGGATALFFLWQRISYGVLSYADAVFYPWRRDAVAAKKGQAFIAEGTDLWRQKKYHEAATLLRQGLALYPQDFRARITPAQYCLLANRRPRPLWLDARDADLRLAQISIGHGLGWTSESLGAAKLYLNGEAVRPRPGMACRGRQGRRPRVGKGGAAQVARLSARQRLLTACLKKSAK